MPVDRLADLTQSLAALADGGRSPRAHDGVAARRRPQARRARDSSRGACSDRAADCAFRRCRASRRPTSRRRATRMCGWWRWRGWRARARDAGRPYRSKWTGRLYGPKLAQVALTFGADHLDAVPATSDAALGPRRGDRRRRRAQHPRRGFRTAGVSVNPDDPCSAWALFPTSTPNRWWMASKAARPVFRPLRRAGAVCGAAARRAGRSRADSGDRVSARRLPHRAGRRDRLGRPDRLGRDLQPRAGGAIRTLALDISSRTSVALTRILCARALAHRAEARCRRSPTCARCWRVPMRRSSSATRR